MNNSKYTEKEISWAINELKKKYPERANKEMAVQYLDTLGSLFSIPIKKIEEDKKSGKLKPIKAKI
jgi:hypothetical protein